MKRLKVIFAGAALLICSAAALQAAEKRCGWVVNPTPANWWLNDTNGEWEISVQGGYQAPGMDNMPDMSTKGWVETNGNYGYGCGCVTGEFDKLKHRVTRLISAAPKPLKACKADKKLKIP